MDKTCFIGNVCAAPETRKVGENSVTNFNVAVNKTVKGERVAKYYRIAAWGKLGEVCAKYVTKGMKIYCEGEATASAYTNKEGKAVASLELMANNIEFLSSKNETAGETKTAPNYSAKVESAEDPDNLPF